MGRKSLLASVAVAATMGVGSLVLQRWVAETRPAALILVIAWFALVGIAVVLLAGRRPGLRTAMLGTFAAVVAATAAVGYWTGFRDTEVDEEVVVATAEASETDRAAGLAGDSAPAEPASGADAKKADEKKPEPKPEGPVNLASGPFTGVDGHDGTGKATVIRASNGDRTLTFTEFDVDPGPTVEVWLTKDESSLEDRIELGTLKGNVGDQAYELPDDADLRKYDTVVLYCTPFTVRIAVAPLG